MNAIRRMEQLSEEMIAAASGYQPPTAMLGVITNDYPALARIAANVAKASGIVHTRVRDTHKVNPAVVDLVEAITRNQRAGAAAAELVAPRARQLHADDIARLREKGAEQWDATTNREYL